MKRQCRLVTTATGTMGRPEKRASVRMPASARRETFGTSALKATVSPSFSARSMARRPSAPPLARASRTTRPRAPDARITRIPIRVSAMVLTLPSAEREMIVAIRSRGRRMNGIMMCWPCHMPAMNGPRPSSQESGFAGSTVKRLVRRTRRR